MKVDENRIYLEDVGEIVMSRGGKDIWPGYVVSRGAPDLHDAGCDHAESGRKSRS